MIKPFRSIGLGGPPPGTRAGGTLALALACALGACGRAGDSPRRLTIAYSNDVRGEIRSCGCTEHDYGGIGRRATFVRALRDTTGDAVLVDAGDFFGTHINYGREKADLTLKSMGLMRYDAVVLGEDDLAFGVDYIAGRARSEKVPVVVANLFDAAADTLVFPASRVVTCASGLRVGIAGVMSPGIAFPPRVPTGSLELRDPLATLQPIIDGMRPNVDIVLVLAHMGRGEAQRMAQDLTGADVVVLGHDGQPMRQVRRFGEAFLLQQPAKGLYMGVAYVTLGAPGRAAAVRDVASPLSKRYDDDEAVAKLFAAYDLDIAAKEQAAVPTAMANPGSLVEDRFAGASACRECHEEIYDHWAGTGHAHAFDILVEASRQYDRDCTPCHTTGFYKKGGFEHLKATPGLVGVQCEQCHGNGAEHVRDPDTKTGVLAREACRECHNAEQSPDFDFLTFWGRIVHPSPGGAPAGKVR
jgi:hypothetical protein